MARSNKKSASKKIAKKPAAARKPATKSAPKKVAARKVPAAKKKPAPAPKRKPAKDAPRQPARTTKSSKAVKSSRPAASAIRSANGKASKESGKANQTLTIIGNHSKPKERRLDPFTRAQKEKLLQLRDAMVDSMAGVAQDTLRARAEGSEASAFGMHQADAGSDAYDRDFALSLLSQEQDALYEIDEALKRIDLGTYGKCEMSGKPILRARLEAIPFARFTVECQSQLEKQSKASRVRQSVTSLFGLTDEEARDGDEEEPAAETKE
ncbi:MAG TPA: TraR/DksA C4-type zinc finger protein [Chthoniobacteraceae bacterium]|nr:TraR/DksA C4-type zinc finger protein [Chthoniobacteraceae bacterium]